jgi:hypothetical protein
MEIFTTTQLTIPVSQVILLLMLSTVALITGRLKLALFINYCFTLYWGYIANMGLFSGEEFLKMDQYTLLYFGSGIVIVLLAMIGLIAHRS